MKEAETKLWVPPKTALLEAMESIPGFDDVEASRPLTTASLRELLGPQGLRDLHLPDDATHETMLLALAKAANNTMAAVLPALSNKQ